MASLGVHSTPGNPHVTQEQLHHSDGSDVLSPVCELGDTHSIENVASLARLTGCAEQRVRLLQRFDRGACYLTYIIQRVSAVVFLHQLQNAVRVLQRWVLEDVPVLVSLVLPRLSIVLLSTAHRVVLNTGEKARLFVEIEAFVDQEGRIRVVFYILPVI